MNANILRFSNLQSISFSIFLRLISITKQSNRPKGITSKDIQLINNGLPNANNIKPSGTNTRSAKSINGKNIFKHIKNLDFAHSFLERNIFTFLKASIIPLAHLFLCLPKSFNFFGTSVKAIAFFEKLVS